MAVRKHKAAIVAAQSFLLRCAKMRNYRRYLHLTTRLQAQAKAWTERKRYARKKTAQILITRIWRGHLARVSTKLLFESYRKAVDSIAKGEAQSRRALRVQEKAGLIRWPNHYDDPRLGKREGERYAARRLQAFARSFLVRVRLRNTAKRLSRLQACCRRKFVHRWYARVQKAGALLVSAWLVRRVRRYYKHKKRAVVVIQAFWRGYCQRGAIVDAFHAQVCIKRWWEARKAMKASRTNILDTMAHVRVLKRMLRRVAAVRIQALVRGVHVRTRVQWVATRKAVVKMQSVYRAHMVRQETRLRRKLMFGSVLVLQQFFARFKMKQIREQEKLQRILD